MSRAVITTLSLAILSVVVKLVVTDDPGMDKTICDPFRNDTVPTPMPELDKSFTAYIEWKWLDRNITIAVTEVQNGILNAGSQTVEMLGGVTKIIYDYQESQYITYDTHKGCTVTGLGTFAFYDDMYWLQATPMIFNMARRPAAFKDFTTVRNTPVGHWVACLDLIQYNITVKIDMYFSASGWKLPMSNPERMIPVRLEITGINGDTRFHVVGDYIDYNPNPTVDETQLQVPPGVFCQGRESRKPMDLLPSEGFSLVMEKVDQTFHKVEYQYVWYDAVNRLVRWDTKPAFNQDPDPTSEVFDFNLGVHYNIDKYIGNCQPVSVLSYGDLFVMPMGNATRMQSIPEFFHVKNSAFQYVGTRTTRGVTCDVWVGVYLDDQAGTNFTIEWYFTKTPWLTAVGASLETTSLFRMAIWKAGINDNPIIFNVLQLDNSRPSLSVFDISACYPAAHKTRVLLHFAVADQGGPKLSTVGKSYLTDSLHSQLTQLLFIPPLRITDLTVFASGDTDLYADFIMLDNAPLVNQNLVPPPPKQHPLSGVLGFLRGSVLGGFNVTFNSTVSTSPVVLTAKALQEINYAQRFTTTTVQTTPSASPVTPPIAPLSPISPTMLTPPRPVVTTPETPPTLPPLTSQQTPCPRCVCSTQTCPSCPTQATCPNCPQCPRQTSPAPCTTQKPSYTTQKPYHIPTAIQQTGSNNSGSQGLNGGVVAAIAIATLLVGLVLGVLVLRLYQRYLQATGAERKTILDNYLNDDERY